MKPFKTHINENSFYTIQSEKDDFINNEKLVINAFFFSFIGFLGLLDGAKDNQKVKMYFKSDKKSRVTEITDENNDASLIIKIMSDKGFFKNPTVVNQITKFLVKVKTGQVDSVDENIIRGWIDEIKPDKLTNLSAVLKKLLQNFRDGGSLASFADDLKSNAKITRWKTTEFADLAKITKIDPAKKKAPSATPSSPTQAAPATEKTPDVKTSASVSKVAVTPSSSKKAKVVNPFNASAIVDAFKSGSSAADIGSGWKINNNNRSELLIKMIADWRGDKWVGYEKEWQTALDYLKSNKVDQNVLQKEIFRGASKFSVKSVEKILDSNIFTLFEKSSAPKLVLEIVNRLVRNIIDRGLDLMTLEELNSYKKSVSSFLNSPIVSASFTPSYRFQDSTMYCFLVDKPESSFVALNKKDLFRNSDGTYSVDYQQYNSAIRSILPSFNITQIDNATAIAKSIANSYRIDWNDYSGKEVKSFYDYLKDLKNSDIVSYQSLVLKILRSLSSASGRIRTEWDNIIRLAAETVNVKEIISELTRTFGSVNIDSMPKDIGGIILKRIGEYLKSNPLSDNANAKQQYSDAAPGKILDQLQTIVKLLAGSNLIDQYKKYITDDYVILCKMIYDKQDYMNFFSGGTRAIPNDQNEFLKYISKEQQDIIDRAAIDRVLNRPGTTIDGPVSFYGNMSAENQKRIISAVNEDGRFLSKIRKISDDKLLNDIDPKDFIKEPNALSTLINYSFDTYEYMDKILALPEGKVLVDKMFSNTGNQYDTRKLLGILAKSKEIDDTKMADYTNQFFSKMKSKDEYYHIPAVLNKLDTETFGKKEKIIFEKSISFADQNIKKLTTEYRSFMTSAQSVFIDYVNNDKSSAEKLYWTMSTSMKRRMASAYMSSKEFSSSISDEISKGLIAPYEKLTNARIKQILKYNNVVSEETKISDKYIRDFASMDAYIKNNNKVKPLEDLQIKEIEATPKELAQTSADVHRTKRSNKHGSNGLIIKKSFNVAIPMQVEAHKKWIEKNPNQQIINPMYHGTGSIAASMILRYGFAVIKSGDSSVVGRMLGNGIYGAINIDKSQQYIGDAGYSKGVGNKGYIFEVDAALGEEGKDYRAMGLGNDGIRSPEWCVFTPNSQFMIFKAHEVEIVSPNQMKEILKENPPRVKVDENNKAITFKSFLKEYVMDMDTDAVENYTTFTFVNGLIPMSGKGGDYVDFEKFKSPNPNTITLEPSAYGPSIVVRGTEEQNDYLFTGPTDMIENYPEIFQEYLNYFVKKE